MSTSKINIIELDGNSLTCEKLYNLGFENYNIKIASKSWDKVKKARKVVDDIVKNKEIVYGVSTGFGNFANVPISTENVHKLQENLIRSHSCGVGDPLPIERARRLLALRINVLAKGFSGVRVETLETMVKALNKNCISYVPSQGTVGASGDLAQLAHMALGLMGEGGMWNPKTKKFEKNSAGKILKENNIEPIHLHAKEGLALINGTQLIASLGAEAVHRSINIVRSADVIAALSLESLHGIKNCFDARIHNARPHNGQTLVAKRMRKLLTTKRDLKNSPLNFNTKRVQDAYTLRCIPQVHGVVNDTLKFVNGIISTELNSGTDNPMIFIEEDGESDLPYKEGTITNIISGGNFHGEYPAKALDFLGIGIHEIASISERRIERLVNGSLSNGLPSFLIKDGGLNSGFMIAHYTAAALTSEGKVLVHPSSSDSIPTSNGQEDHVSMGGFSARKSLDIVKNVENVLAIELMSACQGKEFRKEKTTPVLEEIYELVRTKVKPFEKDREIHSDIVAVCEIIKSGKIWEIVKKHIPDIPDLF